jgi:hypothetical protein
VGAVIRVGGPEDRQGAEFIALLQAHGITYAGRYIGTSSCRPSRASCGSHMIAFPALTDRAIAFPALTDRAIAFPALTDRAIAFPALTDRAIAFPALRACAGDVRHPLSGTKVIAPANGKTVPNGCLFTIPYLSLIEGP